MNKFIFIIINNYGSFEFFNKWNDQDWNNWIEATISKKIKLNIISLKIFVSFGKVYHANSHKNHALKYFFFDFNDVTVESIVREVINASNMFHLYNNYEFF